MSETSFNQPIPYETIAEARNAYLREKVYGYRVIFALIVLGCIVSAYFTLTSITSIWVNEDLARLWFLLWIPFLIGMAAYAFVYGKGTVLFYQGIATAWGWTFLDAWPASEFTGSLRKVGHSHRARYIIVDNPTHPLRAIGDFQYTVGSGKSAHTYDGTFARVTVNGSLPHVLLAVDMQRFDNQILWSGTNLKQVSLEPAYESTLGLYVEPYLEIEALQLFTTSVLEKIVSVWPGYNFECIGNYVYVYAPSVLSNRTQVEELLALLNYILSNIVPRLKAMQGSVRAVRDMSQKKI